MRFAGIATREFDEIRRLNEHFLYALRGPGSAAIGLLETVLGTNGVNWLRRAGAGEIRSLATMPFLLFRLDDVPICSARLMTGSLLSGNDNPEDEVLLLGLSFVWQLARRDNFAARVLSGADAEWCARLGDLPCVRLAELARANSTPLSPTLMEPPFFWPELIRAVQRGERRRLTAIRSAGIQHLLSRQSAGEALAAAARRLAAPERRVADR